LDLGPGQKLIRDMVRLRTRWKRALGKIVKGERKFIRRKGGLDAQKNINPTKAFAGEGRGTRIEYTVKDCRFFGGASVKEGKKVGRHRWGTTTKDLNRYSSKV